MDCVSIHRCYNRTLTWFHVPSIGCAEEVYFKMEYQNHLWEPCTCLGHAYHGNCDQYHWHSNTNLQSRNWWRLLTLSSEMILWVNFHYASPFPGAPILFSHVLKNCQSCTGWRTKKAYVRVNQLDLVRLKGRGLNWWQMRKIGLLSHALHDEWDIAAVFDEIAYIESALWCPCCADLGQQNPSGTSRLCLWSSKLSHGISRIKKII